jgi:hypothetical protein
MSFVQPTTTLSGRGIKLVPLALGHEAGLKAAAADGELWNIRVTSVPEPHETRGYIETALATANRLAFAVTRADTAEVLGSTSYHDIVPATQARRDRLHVVCRPLPAHSRQHHLQAADAEPCLRGRSTATSWAGARTTSTMLPSVPSSGWARARTASSAATHAPRRHDSRHGDVQPDFGRMA